MLEEAVEAPSYCLTAVVPWLRLNKAKMNPEVEVTLVGKGEFFCGPQKWGRGERTSKSVK